jgi:hypothetical protein
LLAAAWLALGSQVNYGIAAPLLSDISSALTSAATSHAKGKQPLQRVQLPSVPRAGVPAYVCFTLAQIDDDIAAPLLSDIARHKALSSLLDTACPILFVGELRYRSPAAVRHFISAHISLPPVPLALCPCLRMFCPDAGRR